MSKKKRSSTLELEVNAEFNKFRDEIKAAMFKDGIPKGKNEQYPYGYMEYLGIKTGYTFEQATAMSENEAEMTADLMYREGLKINYELREKFPNSHFRPICYDNSIVGVDPVTKSIIYDVMYYGYLAIMFIEWSCPKYKDTMYRATGVRSNSIKM